MLESWLKSYKPGELFDDKGKLKDELSALAPEGERRMGANPHANGGLLLKELRLPDFRDYAVPVPTRAAPGEGDTYISGRFFKRYYKTEPKQKKFQNFWSGRDCF